MTYQKKLFLLEKPYLHMSDTRTILGVAYPKFKPVWDKMVDDLEKQTGKSLADWYWGVPTQLVIQYFGIDIDRYRNLATKEKLEVK